MAMDLDPIIPPTGVFANNQNITSVTFCEGVSIMNTNMSRMFFGCSELVSVNNIPQGITTMNQTFCNCFRLVNVIGNIPNSVTSMENTFNACHSLIQAPNIPNSVTNMDGTFKYCTNLTQSPDIPDSVTNMGRTFSGCYNLTQAPSIPNSVTNMILTFEECKNLTTPPILPSNVTTLYGTFRNCTNLTLNGTYNIPELVTNMNSTFRNCVNVTGTINIKSNRINNTSMENCFNGTSLTKTVYVPAVGYNATANTYNAVFNSSYGISGKNGVTVVTITNGKPVHGGGAT